MDSLAVVQFKPKLSSSCSTWVSRHSARDAIVVVEELLPEKLIPRHCKPLTASESSTQHCLMREMQEDLQHQTVWQARTTCHSDILREGINNESCGNINVWTVSSEWVACLKLYDKVLHYQFKHVGNYVNHFLNERALWSHNNRWFHIRKIL